MRQANTIIAGIIALTLTQLAAPCCRAQTPPPGTARSEADTAGFQQTLRSGTQTLDAISQLIAGIQTRRDAAVLASDPGRNVFDDVPSTDRAYAEMMTLQQHDVLLGYPAGFFRGQRTLTRYEIAVAINRVIQTLRGAMPVSAQAPAPSSRPARREDILLISNLVKEFDVELPLLGINLRDVRKLLDARLSADGGKKQDN